MVALTIFQAHVTYVTLKVALKLQVNVSNKPCLHLFAYWHSFMYFIQQGYNVIYQHSLFSYINSRYHAFKLEVRTDSNCKTTQFRSRYMDILQMVLTLIRATLHCISALSVCLVPIVQCTRSQQLRTIPV